MSDEQTTDGAAGKVETPSLNELIQSIVFANNNPRGAISMLEMAQDAPPEMLDVLCGFWDNAPDDATRQRWSTLRALFSRALKGEQLSDSEIKLIQEESQNPEVLERLKPATEVFLKSLAKTQFGAIVYANNVLKKADPLIPREPPLGWSIYDCTPAAIGFIMDENPNTVCWVSAAPDGYGVRAIFIDVWSNPPPTLDVLLSVKEAFFPNELVSTYVEKYSEDGGKRMIFFPQKSAPDTPPTSKEADHD